MQKLLKIAAEGISRSLTSLFNFSLETGWIPLEWKAANVTLMPKGGDSELIENIRPVSVLPVVLKVFERLVHQQLFSTAHGVPGLKPDCAVPCSETRCVP